MLVKNDTTFRPGAIVRIREHSAPSFRYAAVLDHLPNGLVYVSHFVPLDSSSFQVFPDPPSTVAIQGMGLSFCETSALAPDKVEVVGTIPKDGITGFLREKTLREARNFSRIHHRDFFPTSNTRRAFVPGKTTVPYSGRVFNEDEVCQAIDACLDFWLTLGSRGSELERSLSDSLGVKHCLLTNSGSSANLLAVSALTSHRIPQHKRLFPGDEIITCAAGFPTTVAPIVQNRAVPVFIDCDPVSGNPNLSQLEEAYVMGKTKAVIFAHTLGNPFDLLQTKAFCEAHGLWLIEDNCDALGSRYIYEDQGLTIDQITGSFGDMSTQSFYPPHHITMGEGGSVNIVQSRQLKTIVESFRDWGRDCWCPSGKDNTCLKRYDWKLGDLPAGYDHKYIYSHLGYNLKPLDIQAAIGLAQLEKLPGFTASRIANWEYLRRELSGLAEYFEFALPTHASGWTPEGFVWNNHPNNARTAPSWFGFSLLVRPQSPFSKVDFTRALDDAKIGNRGLFGGNLVRQPVFTELKKNNPFAFRVIGDLKGADRVMNECVFIGVYPGLTSQMLEYVVSTIHRFCKKMKL